MNNFTYEQTDNTTTLETFEWDNVWFEHTELNDRIRVFYIGDSISCATRTVATKLSDYKYLFDGFGTSKAVDHPLFTTSINLFAKQTNPNVIIFNNGLHGWHLSENDYAIYYEKIVEFLLKHFNNIPIYIVLTTSVANAERENRVKLRNEKALSIAKKLNLPVIDLYKASSENKDLLSADGVHFTEAGYKLLAKTILEEINK